MADDLMKIPFEDAKGEVTSLSAFEGKVILVVNVASKCGYTKQYAELEKLYQERQEDQFVIIGFPCNDFGGQEPGKIEEILSFCRTEYGVTFPIMSKIHVVGSNQHPLYAAVLSENAPLEGEIEWNFEKILIGKDGKPIVKFGSAVAPRGEELTAAIHTALTE